ncbi:phosphopantetheine-binding protein [Plantactinospora sp. CA-290183]|uniref:phosphopantetheine-binding protein n=1 Tax=Plantactinospora sp. CA-290183 TaxID=3240006 RepID=UPI003D8E70F3
MEAELIEYLRQHLPRYMVPAAVITVPEFPLTPNMKVDATALAAAVPDRDELEADDGRAESDLERELAVLCAGLLGRDRVGIHDHFFRLGGHSLHVMRIASEVRKTYRTTVPVRVIFEQPTVAALAAYIKNDHDG